MRLLGASDGSGRLYATFIAGIPYLHTDECCPEPCVPCNCSGVGAFCSPCGRNLTKDLCVTFSNFTGDMASIPNFSFIISSSPGSNLWTGNVPNAAYQACITNPGFSPWPFIFGCGGFTCNIIFAGFLFPNPGTGPYQVCVPVAASSTATFISVTCGPPFSLSFTVNVGTGIGTCVTTGATFHVTISEDLTNCEGGGGGGGQCQTGACCSNMPCTLCATDQHGNKMTLTANNPGSSNTGYSGFDNSGNQWEFGCTNQNGPTQFNMFINGGGSTGGFTSTWTCPSGSTPFSCTIGPISYPPNTYTWTVTNC